MNAQPLVEHLKELRRRLMWVAAVLLLCLFAAVPFANRLYALVAKPLMASLPPGAHMQAIDVIAPVFVPLKVALMAAAYALPAVGLRGAGALPARETAGVAAVALKRGAVFCGDGVLLFFGVPAGV